MALRTSSTRLRIPGRLYLAALSVFLLSLGCNGSTIPIHDLLANTGGYDGKTVQVAGTVKSAAGALGYGVYQIDDGTGTIMVVTESGGAPAKGAKVGVQGIFHSAFTIGTDTVAVIVEKERRTL